jgi:hypothetical protein
MTVPVKGGRSSKYPNLGVGKTTKIPEAALKTVEFILQELETNYQTLMYDTNFKFELTINDVTTDVRKLFLRTLNSTNRNANFEIGDFLSPIDNDNGNCFAEILDIEYGEITVYKLRYIFTLKKDDRKVHYKHDDSTFDTYVSPGRQLRDLSGSDLTLVDTKRKTEIDAILFPNEDAARKHLEDETIVVS